MLSLLLAVPSCIYSFGTVSSLHPTSFLMIFTLVMIAAVMAMIRTIATAATTPPMTDVVLLAVGVFKMVVVSIVPLELVLSTLLVVEHSLSLRGEITTEHSESTFIRTPVTTILGPSLAQSSIRVMSEPLSVSEVPASLA